VPIGPRDDPLDPRSLSQFGPVNLHHVLYRPSTAAGTGAPGCSPPARMLARLADAEREVEDDLADSMLVSIARAKICPRHDASTLERSKVELRKLFGNYSADLSRTPSGGYHCEMRREPEQISAALA